MTDMTVITDAGPLPGYLARPDATIAGRNVHEARVEIGRASCRERV